MGKQKYDVCVYSMGRSPGESNGSDISHIVFAVRQGKAQQLFILEKENGKTYAGRPRMYGCIAEITKIDRESMVECSTLEAVFMSPSLDASLGKPVESLGVRGLSSDALAGYLLRTFCPERQQPGH